MTTSRSSAARPSVLRAWRLSAKYRAVGSGASVLRAAASSASSSLSAGPWWDSDRGDDEGGSWSFSFVVPTSP